MATQLGEAFVKITAENSKLKTAMGEARDITGKTAKEIESRWAIMGARMQAEAQKMTTYVTLPILAILGASTKAAMEQEAATEELRASLAATGGAAASTVKRLEAFASEMQKVTIYADEVTTSGMAYAHNLGVQTEQLEEATRAAMGLAAKYNIELKTAFMLVGRASQGQTQMLTRYGIVLDETGDKSQKFAQLLRIGASSFDLAKAKAKTTTGQMIQMRNAIGEIGETIGFTLIPLMRAVIPVLTAVSNVMAGMGPTWSAFAVGIALALAAIGPAIRGLKALVDIFKQIRNSAILAKAAAGDWKGLALAASIAGATIAGLAALEYKGAKASEAAGVEAEKQAKQIMETAKAHDKMSTAAKQAVSVAAPAMEDLTDKYREQGQRILDIAQAAREARKEEEERQKSAIGWSSLTDMYRQAAVAGQMERFKGGMGKTGVYGGSASGPTAFGFAPHTPFGGAFTATEINDAIKAWRNTERNTEYMAKWAERLARSLELAGQVR